jgi:hypothetical protein
MHTVKRLDAKVEWDMGLTDTFTIRRKKRFTWSVGDKQASLQRYSTYHRSLRPFLSYIKGDARLWYINAV